MIELETRDYDKTYQQIKNLLEEGRRSVAQTVNLTLLHTYHEIGRTIVEDEQGHLERAEYGKGLLLELSRALTKESVEAFRDPLCKI